MKLLLLYFIIFLLKEESSCLCPNEDTFRTAPNAPYQAALLYNILGVDTFICSGAIISKDVVISAAHCTSGTNPSNWKIRAGSSNHNHGGEVIRVSSIVRHGDFNWITKNNDIALLFLEKSLNFSEIISEISLPQTDEISETKSFADEMLVSAGWGSSGLPFCLSQQLQVANMEMVNNELCIKSHPSYIIANMICARKVDQSRNGKIKNFLFNMEKPCRGDIGGPLVKNGTLIGITVGGNGCFLHSSPMVYINISDSIEWINSKLMIV